MNSTAQARSSTRGAPVSQTAELFVNPAQVGDREAATEPVAVGRRL